MQVRVVLLVSTLFVAACERAAQEYEPLKLQKDRLMTSQFVGVWMIDDESLQYLQGSLGYRVYTNATDHVALLNSDSTCAFVGFATYVNQKFCRIQERDYANDMENSLNAPKPAAITDRFCLCEVTKGYPFLVGPYEMGSNVTNTPGRVFRKTLWSRWSVCKRERPVALEDYTQYQDWEYKICLERPLCASLIVKGDSIDMYIGEDKKGVYLMIPAVVDDHMMRLGIKFRKVQTVRQAL